jgi:hypothetical protein
MTIQITYSHTSNSSSSAKRFNLGLTEDTVITEKVPPQLQQIISCIILLSDEQPSFTYNDIIQYIDSLCEIDNSTFTRSKGGTERIVRYYGKLLQQLNVLVDASSIDTELDFNTED